MLASLGVKATTGDSTSCCRRRGVFDTLDGDAAVGGLYFSFEKYGIQVESAAFTPGADPSLNAPPSPADRRNEVAVSTYNLENLYDFRDDPTDGCDFVGNTGCPGVSPPFDYVPASDAVVPRRLGDIADADHRRPALARHRAHPGGRGPGHLLDVTGAPGLRRAPTATANPTRSRSWRWPSRPAGGGTYDAAYDRDGADDRGIVSAFLYRTDRLSLVAPSADDPVLGVGADGRVPGARARRPTPTCSNPKTLNAELPDDVDTSTGVDGDQRLHPGPAGRPLPSRRRNQARSTRSTCGRSATTSRRHPTPGSANAPSRLPTPPPSPRPSRPPIPTPGSWWAATSTCSRGPTTRSRRAIPLFPSDQLGPLYEAGLANLWDDLVADVPTRRLLVRVPGPGPDARPAVRQRRSARRPGPDAGGPRQCRLARRPPGGDGARGLSDHDPAGGQVLQ